LKRPKLSNNEDVVPDEDTECSFKMSAATPKKKKK
jgi:hypothetical protein